MLFSLDAIKKPSGKEGTKNSTFLPKALIYIIITSFITLYFH